MLAACFLSSAATATAAPDLNSEHAQKTLEIYKHIISVETSKNLGNVPEVANYLADELIAAGLPKEDVEVVPVGETAALIARYRGDGSSGKGPILLLGHMDVVEARAEDWERPPFELTKDDTYFYARGSIDNKFGVAQLTSTFIRLKKEGFVPNRDLIIAFSGDEETGMVTTRMLAYEREDLAEAEFALNSDAGGGDLSEDGKAIVYLIQAAEKTYVTWEITVTNPGGHSSRPRPDNAIYDLADAIQKIRDYRFPVRWSDMTLEFFEETGQQLGGDLGACLGGAADVLGLGKDPGPAPAGRRYLRARPCSANLQLQYRAIRHSRSGRRRGMAYRHGSFRSVRYFRRPVILPAGLRSKNGFWRDHAAYGQYHAPGRRLGQT